MYMCKKNTAVKLQLFIVWVLVWVHCMFKLSKYIFFLLLSISHLMLSSCCPCWSPWLKEMVQIHFSASQGRVLRWDTDPNNSLTALALTLTSVKTSSCIHCENIYCDFSICVIFLVPTVMQKIYARRSRLVASLLASTQTF